SSTTVPAGTELTFDPTVAITPSWINTSAGREPMASTTVPPLMTTAPRLRLGGDKVDSGAEQQVENGHAHRHPVGDLPSDERARLVRHLGGHLDPPVDGAGVHDQGLGGEEPGPLSGQAVGGGVLAE